MPPPAGTDALEYCERIRDLVLHHSGGWADAENASRYSFNPLRPSSQGSGIRQRLKISSATKCLSASRLGTCL